MQTSAQKTHIAKRDDPSQIASLLNHHISQTDSHILLISTQQTAIDLTAFENKIARIAVDDAAYAETLEQRLNAIDLISTVTDITPCCSQLDTTTTKPLNDQSSWQGKLLTPTDFAHTITREQPRFLIRTSIQVNAHNNTFKTTTMDVSTSGLAFNLPGKEQLNIGSRVTIDFIRWQSQTSSLKLTQLIYIVRNCRFWAGATRIGLERESVGATQSINRFFNATLERNKTQLAIDHQHTFISQESRIFGTLLGQQLTTIPFYLGMDEDNKRILQAVVSDRNDRRYNLWLTLQNLVTMMSELIKSLSDSDTNSIHFGIYCYQDKQDNWQLTTDHDFNSVAQKSVFINRAIVNEHHHFSIAVCAPLNQSGSIKKPT